MDFFTHVLLPYLLGCFFRRSRKEVTAMALGGAAPDLDLLLLWINDLYPNFFLIVHRGITHSLFFGFFACLAVVYLASRERVSFKLRHLGLQPTFTGRVLLFAYAGVGVHLFLDTLTTRGVPLFYPLDITRWSAELLFYTETPLILFSLVVLIYLFKRRGKVPAGKLLMVFLLLMAIIGGIRLVEKESAEDIFGQDAEFYPTSNLFQWSVLVRDEKNMALYRYDGLTGTVLHRGSFLNLDVRSQGYDLEKALKAAEDLPQVKTFRWRAYAVAVNASFQEGGWNLEYLDPIMMDRAADIPPQFRGSITPMVSIKVRVDTKDERISATVL